MTSRMVGFALTLVTLLLSVGDVAAQTYTQMQWGMNKGVTPYGFGANINGTWRDLGTVSATGVWSLTVNGVLNNASVVYTPEMISPTVGTGGDDTATLQTWLNACLQTRVWCAMKPNGSYKISSTLDLKFTSWSGPTPPFSPAVDIHFLPQPIVHINGNGATITATAYMTRMFNVVFNSSLAAIAPYYTTISDLTLNGANLATTGFYLNFAEKINLINNRVYGAYTGIFAQGYGVHEWRHNSIYANWPIYCRNGGCNDSLIENNDLFSKGSAFIIFETGFNGNGDVKIRNNVFTAGDSATPNGIVIYGDPQPGPTLTAGSGGSLSAGTYYVQVNGFHTETGSEMVIYQTASVAVGASGSITLTLPNEAGYTYNVYLDSVSPPAHYGSTSGGNAFKVAGGSTITLTSIGSAATPAQAIYSNQFLIDGNQFNGSGGGSSSMPVAVFLSGTLSSGDCSLKGVNVTNNFYVAAGSSAGFIQTSGVCDVYSSGNMVNSLKYPTMVGTAFNIASTKNFRSIGDFVEKTSSPAYELTNVTYSTISKAHLNAVGPNGGNVITLWSNSQYNEIEGVIADNTVASHASVFAGEAPAGPNYNRVINPLLTNIATPVSFTGANSLYNTPTSASAAFTFSNAALFSGGWKVANLAVSASTPTIGSGFGTSPSIVANNGTAAFQINVGTGGTASSGVITMPAATNGWSCSVSDITTPASNFTKQTASTTTSVTITNYNTSNIETAWTASDKINLNCMAF